MKLRVRCLDLDAGGKMIAIINSEDARELGIHPLERIVIKKGKQRITVVANVSEKFVLRGDIAVYNEVRSLMRLNDGDFVYATPRAELASKLAIRKKMDGGELSYKEIKSIVDDVIERNLNDLEQAALITALHIHGLTSAENFYFARAMIETSAEKIKFPGTVVDKHSITGDMPVLIRHQGRIKKVQIGPFVDQLIESKKPKIIDGSEYLDVNGFEVPVFDEQFRIKFVPLTGVWRHPASSKILELKLKGNRKVKVTEGHSVFVLRDGRINCLPTRHLRVGDFVVVPRHIPCQGRVENIDLIKVASQLPESYRKKLFIVGIEEKYKQEILKSGRGWLYYQGLTPLDIYLKNPKPLPKNAKLKEYHGKPLPVVIKWSESLARFLGYYIAEGFVNEIGVFISLGRHEKRLLQKISSDIKNILGFEPTYSYPHPTAVHICIYSKLFATIFQKIFHARSRAHTKGIPEDIFNLPHKLQLEFLRAYFEGNGYIRRNYEAAIATTSKKLATDLQYLLSALGMSFSISEKESSLRQFPNGLGATRQAYLIYTQANDLLERSKTKSAAFTDFIPLVESSIKDFMLQSKMENGGIAKRQDFITFDELNEMPLLQNEGELESEDFAFLSGDLSFLPIKEINELEVDEKYVYDFSVEGYEKFIGGEGPIFLHNSCGGVPGDKTTLLLVPIIAATGLTIPKTSSRAITDPAGTADRVEVLCPVDIEPKKIVEVVRKTRGCMVWGGALKLAPADDLLIQIERPLALDPLIIPSVLSKKAVVGSKYVVIDLPCGPEAKMTKEEDAEKLGRKFIDVGKKLGIRVHCVVTRADQPIGYAIGPALEAREALAAITNPREAPADLIDKATSLAGILLQMVKKGNKRTAERILFSGRAEKKLREIIGAQGGNPKIKPSDIDVEARTIRRAIRAPKSGLISYISNRTLVRIAKLAGAPKDRYAGILLNKKLHEHVRAGEPLYTIYAEKPQKLAASLQAAKENNGFTILTKRRVMTLAEMDHGTRKAI